MDIIEINTDSPAGQRIKAILADPNTYCLRLAVDGGPDAIKVKQNGSIWSPPLSTVYTAGVLEDVEDIYS